MANKRKLIILYVLFDILAAMATWVIFFVFRKYNVDNQVFNNFDTTILNDNKFYLGLFAYPLFWLFLHTFSGIYKKVYKKSRLKELGITMFVVFLGTLAFFFAFILDDIINNYNDYLLYFAVLFLLQFFLTYIPRVIITTSTIDKIRNGEICFNTLIIGSDNVALNTYNSIITHKPHTGNSIIGYIIIDNNDEDLLSNELPCLGKIDDLMSIVTNNEIAELIIAIQNGKRKYIEKIITMIMDTDIDLKIIPQMQDYLMGSVKVSAVLQEPLIPISLDYLADWQQYTKRFFDIFLSLIAITLLLPAYLFLAVGVLLSSRGPIFYTQERIGYKGKPFKIIKFRSMVVNAENNCPQLSSKDDPRITRFGKFMRQSRLDETPQFFNVLMGDMSLVGPRPERQYYIDKIVEKAPHYKLLLRVKPGITSWGQVKFGYAENVDEMVQRLKWDILYLENMSLQMDIKILIYTVLIVLKRTGK
ncbi:MAG TPA: sugar transferase [Bacteroidales bacterium]|nr:sugar transferase [Bacteroidales bacterium]